MMEVVDHTRRAAIVGYEYTGAVGRPVVQTLDSVTATFEFDGPARGMVEDPVRSGPRRPVGVVSMLDSTDTFN